jgi:hypothetical protein
MCILADVAVDKSLDLLLAPVSKVSCQGLWAFWGCVWGTGGRETCQHFVCGLLGNTLERLGVTREGEGRQQQTWGVSLMSFA